MYDNNGNIVKRREFAFTLKDNTLIEELESTDKVSVVGNNGSIISDANHIGNLNPFRYRGYYYDTETKLYFLKTRYYDPEIGRFISQDGVEYLDPETINGLNLYAYCVNNPVMNVDPNGTIGILVGILIGVLIGAVVVGTGVAIYAGVTAYNNGVRGWDLVGAIAEGFLTGAVIGAIIGWVIAAFIYGGPAIASFLGKSFSFGGFALAGGGTAVITLTGAQIAALGVATLLGLQILFSKGSGPRFGHNQHEKQMWDEAMRRLNIKDKDLSTRLHNKNHKYPYQNTLKGLVEQLKEILRKWGKL